MNYKKINDYEIEIIPGITPLDRVLENMARISYESAESPGSEFLELLDTKSKEIDFSSFVHLDHHKVLDMDYVNERQCKTKVRKTHDGKYVFDAESYKVNRGSPELFMNKVKSALEEDVEDSETSAQSDKRKPRRGLAEFLLELILDLFDDDIVKPYAITSIRKLLFHLTDHDFLKSVLPIGQVK